MLTTPINLCAVLEQQILPWAMSDGIGKLVYTANTWDELHAQGMPEAVHATPKPRRGRRVSCHGPRHYGNTSVRVAHWPEDNQDMLRYPTLACVVQGTADFHVADYVLHCPHRHFVLFRAGVPTPGNSSIHPHFEGKSEGRFCEVVWISPRMGGEGGLAIWTCRSEGSRHWNSGVPGNGFVRHEALSTVFNLFVQCVEEKKEDNRQLTTSSLVLCLQLLLHCFQNDRFAPGRAILRKPESQSFHMAERYIRENIGKPLTIDDVAQAVFMSRSTFTRQFRMATGRSFHQYLSELRLQQARMLLTEGRWAVKTVARMVGLQPNQLRLLFHRELGISPTALRNQSDDETAGNL